LAALDFSAAPPQNAKKWRFYWDFRKNPLFCENENQLQNPVFETFGINIASQ